MRRRVETGHAGAASSAGSKADHAGVGLVPLVGIAMAALLVMAASVVPASSQQPPERTTIAFFDKNGDDFGKSINEGS